MKLTHDQIIERAFVGWRERAACLDEDPELFFPDGSGPAAMRQIEEAKAVCRGCPVIASCLQWALGAKLQHGVCGGTTPDERAVSQVLRRQRGEGPTVRAPQSGRPTLP